MFVDTGGWYAVVAVDDRCHEVSERYFHDLLRAGDHLLTSDYVLDETLTRLRYDFGLNTAITFWQMITRAHREGFLTILQVDETVWQSAMNIFQRFDDQNFSFTDCTSFALLQERPVDEVFGFDRHFSIFGFALKPGLSEG